VREEVKEVLSEEEEGARVQEKTVKISEKQKGSKVNCLGPFLFRSTSRSWITELFLEVDLIFPVQAFILIMLCGDTK
jgi:hypothetical protein